MNKMIILLLMNIFVKPVLFIFQSKRVRWTEPWKYLKVLSWGLYFLDILGEGEQALVLSDGLVQALQLRTCDADHVVARFHESLSLDLASLERPDPETKRQIRCICLKAKSTDRLDVVKRLREIAPAGTTGMIV